MKKGAVALLVLAAMACVSTSAMAAKKAPKAGGMTVEGCKTFLEQAQAASGATAAPAAKSKLTVDGCKEFIANEERRAAYRNGVEEANSVDDLQLFIDMFSNDDPDKQVPKAKAKLKALQAKEAADAAAAAAAAPAAQ